MLIYEKVNQKYFVTEIIMGFSGNRINFYKTELSRMPESHAEKVVTLKTGEVYVTGNSSILGDGIQDRYTYQHYLQGNDYE